MNAKLTSPNLEWSDPDDAPELTEQWFASATAMAGEQAVTRPEWNHAVAVRKRGRPVGSAQAVVKRQTNIRFDLDVLLALKASGKGWQTRVNALVRRELGV